MTHEQADREAQELFGDDAFCAVCQDETCEVIIGGVLGGSVAGRGHSFEEAIENTIVSQLGEMLP